MTPPIALQLYSVRDAMQQDGFDAVIRNIASMGFAGVETAGFPGTTPESASKLFNELGLTVPSAHVPLPLDDKKNEVLDILGALNAKQMTSPGIGHDPYKTIDGIKAAAENFNKANAIANENGHTFAIHNHWMEFQEVDGRNAHEILLDHLDETVLFQLDTYWVQTAGLDAATIVKKFGDRAPTLHIKDGPCDQKADMVALGEGSMDIGAVIKAGKGSTEWLIIELDRCGTDMLEAVEKSINYLISEGYGRGA